MGDIYLTTNSNNPSTKYLGTTWQKIEGRFLLGTSGSGASKQTGGSMSKTIQQANLPNVKLKVDSFSLTTQPHTHSCNPPNSAGTEGYGKISVGNEYAEGNLNFNTNAGGGQNTGTASPQTSTLGSGQALDITPSYYTTHMWLRTS